MVAQAFAWRLKTIIDRRDPVGPKSKMAVLHDAVAQH
jgi:hypothetical protein